MNGGIGSPSFLWLVKRVVCCLQISSTIQEGSILRRRKNENAALLWRLGLPSSLICHENGALRKRSSNRRNLKTPDFRFRLDRKHFEPGICSKMIWFPWLNFSQTQIQKGRWFFLFWIPPAQCRRKTFHVFSERNLCFNFLRPSMDRIILLSRTSCGTYSLVLLTIISNLPKPLCTSTFFLSCNRGYDGVVTFLPAPAVENSPQDKTRCRSGWVNRSVMHATCYLIGRTKKDGKKTCRPQAWRMKTSGALANYDF